MSLFAELNRRNVVRVAFAYVIISWVLAQVADLVLGNISAPSWVMQTIMLVLALGFPMVLFFSWAFEVTPEGIKRESDVVRSDSITKLTSRKLDRTITALLIVALAYFFWESRIADAPQPPEPLAVDQTAGQAPSKTVSNNQAGSDSTSRSNDEQSIAVLPFENFSGDQSDQYFADGLADTLLHKLAQISNLKVIARNSSFQFKGTNRDIREIGEILDVKTVLEGSVQRAGNQVRIIAQLINTSDGVHIWSQSFDDSMDNIFALQDRVAADIVAQLQVNLSKEEQGRLLRNGTDNLEAYDLVMRALNYGGNLDSRVDVDGTNFEPVQMLEKAVELDPQYAEAWAQLSRQFNSLAFAADSAEEFNRYVSQSRTNAEEALRLDPDLSYAHQAMGWVEHRIGESHKAAQHFRRALELNPNNGGAMAGLGLQVIRSDPEEALRLFTRSHEIDPTSTFSYRQKHFALMMLGRTEEAIQQLKLGIEADPSEGVFYNDLSDLLIGIQGRPDEAARQVTKLLQLAPRSFTGTNAMVEAWIEAGDESRASSWVEQLMKERDDSDDAMRLNARRLHTFSRFDEALSQLDEVQVNDENARDMMLRRLTANLGLGDQDAIAKNHQAYTDQLNAMKNKGAIPKFSSILGTIIGVLAREATEADYDPTATLNSLPPLENVPFLKSANFLQAGIHARLGNLEQAMVLLEHTLQKPDGGVFNTDALQFSVEESPFLSPLRDEPAFQDWLQRYRLRRDAMLKQMIEMENRGEIISAATVNRVTGT